MTDTQVNVLTRLVPDGTTATVRVGPPVNRTYTSIIQSNSSAFTIPSAHMGNVAQANLTAEIILPSETLTETISIVQTTGKPVFGAITQNGEQLTINWTANNPARKFDVHVGSSPQPNDDNSFSNDLGDSVGIGSVESHTFTINYNGTVYIRILYSDNNWDDAATNVADGRYIDTTFDLVNNENEVFRVNVLERAQQPLSHNEWNEMTGNAHVFFTGDSNLWQTTQRSGQWWIRATHPSGYATDLTEGAAIPYSGTATAHMKMMFDSNWGPGQGSTDSGKLGFGLAGGSYFNGSFNVLVSGGSTATTGWSFRWGFDDDEIIGYAYYRNRPGMNYPNPPPDTYLAGEFIYTGVTITPHQVYDCEMQVILNTPSQTNGSLILRIDGQEVARRNNVIFMEGTPQLTRMFHASNHGGGGSSWAPSTTTGVLYRDIYLTAP